MNPATSSFFNPLGITTSAAGPESKHFAAQKDHRNVHHSMSHQSSTNDTLKVKRRKTKKERNNGKFHKSEMEKVLRKGSWSMLHRMDVWPRPFCTRLVQPLEIRGTCNSNPVIITQSRLSRHHGMFDREVKSVDIERLLNQGTEKNELEFPKRRAKTANQNRTGSANPNPDMAPSVEEQGNSPNSRGPETQATEPNAGVPQGEEKENTPLCGQEISVHLSTPSARSGSENQIEEKQPAPVLQVTERICKMLNSRILFPGRNLVSETQKSIMDRMRQKGLITANQSTFPGQRNLDCSPRANVGDGSGWGQFNKAGLNDRPRSQASSRPPQRSPTASLPGSGGNYTHTVIKKATDGKCNKKSEDFFHQNVLYGLDYKKQQEFAEDGAHTSKFPSPRVKSDLVCDNRSKLQRNTEAFRRALRSRTKLNPSGITFSPQRGWNCTQDDLHVSHYGHKHNSRYNTSPTHWESYEQVPSTRGPLQEIFTEQGSHTGLKIKHRAAGENQTSFDVLSSIWNHGSDRTPSSMTSGNYQDPSPAEPRLCYNEQSQHRIVSDSEVGRYHGGFAGCLDFIYEEGGVSQTESFDPSSLLRQKTQRFEPELKLHHDLHPSKSLLRWRSRGNLWSPVSAPKNNSTQAGGMDNTWDKHWHGNEDWSLATGQSGQYSQHGQLLRSLVPPSESLDQEDTFHSPSYGRSFRQTQLGRLSPEAWVFPRMKLY
ncbi:proline-rich protein 19 [Pelodytes ibericus]